MLPTTGVCRWEGGAKGIVLCCKMHQRTINLSPSHPVRAMEGLAKQIALPHEFAPLRFPSFPALERTATMGFSAPTVLNLDTTERSLLVFRQAAYPLWATYTATDTIYSVTYRTEKTAEAWTNSLTVDGRIAAIDSSCVGNQTATADHPGFSGFNKPLISYPIIGADSRTGALPFVYVPPGYGLGIVGGGQSAYHYPTAFTVNFEQWQSPGEVVPFISPDGAIAALDFAGKTAWITTKGGMWVRPVSISFSAGTVYTWPSISFVTLFITQSGIQYTGSNATQGSVSMAATATKVSLLPLVEPVEFVNSKLPWYATRTTAAAVLATNVSPVMAKGGTILGGRVSPNVMSPWLVTSSYVNGLHPAEKAFLPLETGVYTYVPPSTDLANFWDYTSYSTPDGSAPTVPLFRLDNDALYNIMFITATSNTEALAITVDWHLEFRTSSALFDVGLCTMSLESLHTCQLALAQAGFFFENPMHKAILNRVVSAAKTFGPSLLSMVHPALGKAASLMMSKSPAKTNKMVATSAAGSGVTTKTKGVKVAKKKVKVAKKKH